MTTEQKQKLLWMVGIFGFSISEVQLYFKMTPEAEIRKVLTEFEVEESTRSKQIWKLRQKIAFIKLNTCKNCAERIFSWQSFCSDRCRWAKKSRDAKEKKKSTAL